MDRCIDDDYKHMRLRHATTATRAAKAIMGIWHKVGNGQPHTDYVHEVRESYRDLYYLVHNIE